MRHLGRFTKTPYLVLFVILGTAGIGTAYAGILPLITLAGDVQVDGDLNVDGTTTSSSYDYSSANQRFLTISPGAFAVNEEAVSASAGFGAIEIKNLAGLGFGANAVFPITSIPDGAKLQSLTCHFRDNDPVKDPTFRCKILRTPLVVLTNAIILSLSATTSGSSNDYQPFTDSTISGPPGNEIFDTENFSYHLVITFVPDGLDNCADEACTFGNIQIKYTVMSSD